MNSYGFYPFPHQNGNHQYFQSNYNPYFQQPERFEYVPQQDWDLQQVQENSYGQVPDQFDVERQPQQLERRVRELERQNERQTRELSRQNQEITRINREVNRVNQEITRLSQADQRHTNRLNRLNQRLRAVERNLNIPFSATDDGF
ncbi:hypothetical protein [Peribacillus sp. ACCC06369]|uniref:hypothetical protein n=1 Tax=Peribacillus sp. ACCC06369 TaxID=3055860 RepID=UPI0025A30382|nr:hypothetical protein [Peribacillus sp. ACCC06369]MDM5356874.1 hypothetical protein [Peribacillus sp. ACCC06369]